MDTPESIRREIANDLRTALHAFDSTPPMAIVPTPRTDREIVDQTNELARRLYRLRGYETPEGHKFYEFDRRNYHPHEREAWDAACEAQELLTSTDANDALDNLDEEN